MLYSTHIRHANLENLHVHRQHPRILAIVIKVIMKIPELDIDHLCTLICI